MSGYDPRSRIQRARRVSSPRAQAGHSTVAPVRQKSPPLADVQAIGPEPEHIHLSNGSGPRTRSKSNSSQQPSTPSWRFGGQPASISQDKRPHTFVEKAQGNREAAQSLNDVNDAGVTQGRSQPSDFVKVGSEAVNGILQNVQMGGQSRQAESDPPASEFVPAPPQLARPVSPLKFSAARVLKSGNMEGNDSTREPPTDCLPRPNIFERRKDGKFQPKAPSGLQEESSSTLFRFGAGAGSSKAVPIKFADIGFRRSFIFGAWSGKPASGQEGPKQDNIKGATQGGAAGGLPYSPLFGNPGSRPSTAREDGSRSPLPLGKKQMENPQGVDRDMPAPSPPFGPHAPPKVFAAANPSAPAGGYASAPDLGVLQKEKTSGSGSNLLTSKVPPSRGTSSFPADASEASSIPSGAIPSAAGFNSNVSVTQPANPTIAPSTLPFSVTSQISTSPRSSASPPGWPFKGGFGDKVKTKTGVGTIGARAKGGSVYGRGGSTLNADDLRDTAESSQGLRLEGKQPNSEFEFLLSEPGSKRRTGLKEAKPAFPPSAPNSSPDATLPSFAPPPQLPQQSFAPLFTVPSPPKATSPGSSPAFRRRLKSRTAQRRRIKPGSLKGRGSFDASSPSVGESVNGSFESSFQSYEDAASPMDYSPARPEGGNDDEVEMSSAMREVPDAVETLPEDLPVEGSGESVLHPIQLGAGKRNEGQGWRTARPGALKVDESLQESWDERTKTRGIGKFNVADISRFKFSSARDDRTSGPESGAAAKGAAAEAAAANMKFTEQDRRKETRQNTVTPEGARFEMTGLKDEIAHIKTAVEETMAQPEGAEMQELRKKMEMVKTNGPSVGFEKATDQKEVPREDSVEGEKEHSNLQDLLQKLQQVEIVDGAAMAGEKEVADEILFPGVTSSSEGASSPLEGPIVCDSPEMVRPSQKVHAASSNFPTAEATTVPLPPVEPAAAFRFQGGPTPTSPQGSIGRRHVRRAHRERQSTTHESLKGERLTQRKGNRAALSPTTNMSETKGDAAPPSAWVPPVGLPQGGFGLDGIVPPVTIGGAAFVAKDPATIPSAAVMSVVNLAEQACEKWRLNGNQAYAVGDFAKAEEYYSRGANSVAAYEKSSASSAKAAMLCYSNRAAARMLDGSRMRDALEDCLHAIQLDPTFLRVKLRAASCHLALGELDQAGSFFQESLKQSKEGATADAKVAMEAVEGIKKVAKVEEALSKAKELLTGTAGVSGDPATALKLLSEGLLIAPNSEAMLELKGWALLHLRRYSEVVALCDETLPLAERNHPTEVLRGANHVNGAQAEPFPPVQMWRWRLAGRANFSLGNVEEALELLLKSDKERPGQERSGSLHQLKSKEAVAKFVSGVRELLRLKAAGNEAFQAGRHVEAVEHYTTALAMGPIAESRPFSAVCLGNRAAASQALGQVADAIADCSRAIALDPSYAKAISRRATLYETVRASRQAVSDLQRLIHLSAQANATGDSGKGKSLSRAYSSVGDAKQLQARLVNAEEDVKRALPIDHYLLLELEPSCSPADVKKAYRKAALRHHPDKAGQFLAKGEGEIGGNLWKDVGEEIQREAERLFKLIGEANAILSDPQKRRQYDADEDLRKLRTRSPAYGHYGDAAQTSAAATKMYSNVFSTHGTGRRTRDKWEFSGYDGYSHQNAKWQGNPFPTGQEQREAKFKSSGGRRGSSTYEYDWDDL